MSARYIVGDTRDVLATMPDNSVDFICTSPPFLALRSYLPDDHVDKHREIGSEPDPATFIDTLLALTADWRRVLAPHGSICVELGDTYSNTTPSGTALIAGHNPGNEGHLKQLAAGHSSFGPTTPTRTPGKGWPLAKSLALIPELYRIGLAYGRNPLTGTPSPAGRWRVRNVVRWVRPNPPVGALGDKFRPATSDLVIACTATDRWFDLDAVRQAYSETTHTGGGPNVNATDINGSEVGRRIGKTTMDNAGAPPLDWWKISPQGYEGSHYAVYPPELCVKPIEAMCPRRVCRTCGRPSRRETERTEEYAAARAAIGDFNQRADGQGSSGSRSVLNKAAGKNITSAENVTTGWSTCGCPGTDGIRHDGYHTGDGWRPGVVLDPFAGTFTTGVVAHGHGRDSIGIDLDYRNVDLARERLGMFLDVDEPENAA